MRHAIGETQRSRKIQLEYNEEHGSKRQSIRKAVNDILIEGFGRERDGATGPEQVKEPQAGADRRHPRRASTPAAPA